MAGKVTVNWVFVLCMFVQAFGVNAGFAEFDVIYTSWVMRDTEQLFTYKYNISRHSLQAVRVHVYSAQASEDYPTLFVIRQQRGVISWQVPLQLENIFSYYTVNRTLCPTENYHVGKKHVDAEQFVYVDISTSNPTNTTFILYSELLDDFEISLNEKRTIDVSPSEPKYYQFSFPNNTDFSSITIRAVSDDDHCMDLSVQNINCPVFDLDRNVEFTGIYQTMTKQAAITIQRTDFAEKAFYIVFVVRATDYECTEIATIEPSRAKGPYRIKNVEVVIEPTSKSQYVVAIVVTVVVFLCFYLAAAVIAFILFLIKRRRGEIPGGNLQSPIISSSTPQTNYGTEPPQDSSDRPLTSHHVTSSPPGEESDSSIDDGEIDMLPDADTDKDVFRTKTMLYVADLSRKDRRALTRKYKLYHWNLITVAVFYSLPVVQLVVTYQQVLHVTGNEDICYYNFLCARPLGVLSAFNNVFSNLGYIMLGLLFLALVYRRDLIHQKAVERKDHAELYLGIPKHFGLFYAMGVALIMEGLLSGCYHVCPSYSNFQFDTSFMYIIAGLCMLKIYQNRHPDINANAYAAFAAFAVIIFLAVLGVVYGTIWFWILFFIVHFVATLALTAQIYYMGRWKLDFGILRRIYLQLKNEFLQPSKPMYMDRMILLLFGCLVNWSFAVYGLVTRPKDFASYLLSIMIVNLLAYVLFYIIMKCRSKEKILLMPLIYICLATLCWGSSLYFFLQRLTTWEVSPAKSREGNRECILLNFYDDHDVWHFLSSISMFFSFMILLTLDDDLVQTSRDKIPVF